MRRVVALGVVIVIAGALYMFLQKESVAPTPEPIGAPTFAWVYREFERDGISYTEIALEAMYENDVSRHEVVDTVEGNCNIYENEEPDVYVHSSMIICYYAGLGRYYKIIESDGTYLVQRKIFEEASPEYDPPVQNFETIAEF